MICTYLSECGGECSEVGHESRRDQDVSSQVIVLSGKVYSCLIPPVLLPSQTSNKLLRSDMYECMLQMCDNKPSNFSQ